MHPHAAILCARCTSGWWIIVPRHFRLIEASFVSALLFALLKVWIVSNVAPEAFSFILSFKESCLAPRLEEREEEHYYIVMSDLNHEKWKQRCCFCMTLLQSITTGCTLCVFIPLFKRKNEWMRITRVRILRRKYRRPFHSPRSWSCPLRPLFDRFSWL